MVAPMKKLAVAALAFLLVAGVGLRFVPPAFEARGQVEAAVVEDASRRTPETGAILASPAVRTFCAEKHIAWHVTNTAAEGHDVGEVQWAIDASAAAKLPAIVIRQGGKPKLYPLPATPAAVIALLGRFAD
jgi:hypothetical protein